jgi:hypothetical protein
VRPTPRTAGFERPWYTPRALLLLAPVAGSAERMPRLVERLASEDEEIQRLSIDALAPSAATTCDVTRRASPRALGERIAHHRRERGAASAGRR